MKTNLQGKVLKLFITKDDEQKTREQKESVTVDKNGIIEDKFYAKNEQRAILITSYESYQMAQDNGIEMKIGALGENILIDVNPYHLQAGETIKIGNTLFEITQHCTLCKGLTTVHAKLPKLLKNDRGIFAKMINGSGIISAGDTVEISH